MNIKENRVANAKLASALKLLAKKDPLSFFKQFLYFVPTALCAIVACSWFAHNVIRAFYNPFTPVNTK